MLYNKNNLAVAAFAAKHRIGKAIEYVLFRKDRTVATDSFLLIEVTTPKKKNQGIEDYPTLPAKQVIRDSDDDMLLRAEQVRGLKMVKPMKHLEVMNNVVIADPGVEGKLEIVSANLEETQSVIADTGKEKFPDYEKLFVHEGFEITVNPEYLAKVLKAAAGVNPGEVTLKIQTDSKLKPIEVHAEGRDEQKLRALVMPINL